MPHSNYYDVDAILAEEALIPCAPLFHFSHLSHLDPDAAAAAAAHADNNNNNKQQQELHYLPESTRIEMPLWAVEKWALLGYVKLSLPRQFGRRARERLLADPAQVHLGKRARTERFFLTGRRLVHLLQQHVAQVQSAIRRSATRNSNSSSSQQQQLQALELLSQEANELQSTLVATYTGTRLSHTLNWALSSVGDDVTAYWAQLTQLERRLFQTAAIAAAQHTAWNSRRMARPAPRAVTPNDEGAFVPSSSSNRKPVNANTSNKRRRVNE